MVCFYQNGRGQHFWESGEGVGKMKVVRRVKDGGRGGTEKVVAMGLGSQMFTPSTYSNGIAH